MQLADSAEDWSLASGKRVINDDIDFRTMRISLSGFVSDLKWGPVIDAHTMMSLGDTNSGSTDRLEWQFTDESTETEQVLNVRFRMPQEDNK